MELNEVLPRGINLRLTEEFLLSRPQVLEASVLWSDGKIHAFVTVSEDEQITTGELQYACMESIGLHQTPKTVKLMRAYNRSGSRYLAA